MGCIIMMDSSSPLRKTSYFEKYRKELQRISDEMKNKNHSSSFSEKSKEQPPMARSVTQSYHVPSTQINHSITLNQSVHPAHPTHQASVQPLRNSKKGPVFEAKTQPRPEAKEENENNKEIEEETREAQLLLGEVEAAREKLVRCQEEISQRRIALQSLKRELARHSPSGGGREMQGYAQKMLAIETRMKFKKELHQDELNCLVNDRNQRHAQNVELSKLIQSLQEQLQSLAAEDRREQQTSAFLQAQAIRLQGEIGRLAQECLQAEQRINNSQQLRELSGSDYRRYSEVFRRELLGREIAQCEERIRERNNEKRYLVEIERRKVLARDRKVQNGVRQKALVELTRVIDFVGKEVAALKKELSSLTDKSAFFGK